MKRADKENVPYLAASTLTRHQLAVFSEELQKLTVPSEIAEPGQDTPKRLGAPLQPRTQRSVLQRETERRAALEAEEYHRRCDFYAAVANMLTLRASAESRVLRQVCGRVKAEGNAVAHLVLQALAYRERLCHQQWSSRESIFIEMLNTPVRKDVCEGATQTAPELNVCQACRGLLAQQEREKHKWEEQKLREQQEWRDQCERRKQEADALIAEKLRRGEEDAARYHQTRQEELEAQAEQWRQQRFAEVVEEVDAVRRRRWKEMDNECDLERERRKIELEEELLRVQTERLADMTRQLEQEKLAARQHAEYELAGYKEQCQMEVDALAERAQEQIQLNADWRAVEAEEEWDRRMAEFDSRLAALRTERLAALEAEVSAQAKAWELELEVLRHDQQRQWATVLGTAWAAVEAGEAEARQRQAEAEAQERSAIAARCFTELLPLQHAELRRDLEQSVLTLREGVCLPGAETSAGETEAHLRRTCSAHEAELARLRAAMVELQALSTAKERARRSTAEETQRLREKLAALVEERLEGQKALQNWRSVMEALQQEVERILTAGTVMRMFGGREQVPERTYEEAECSWSCNCAEVEETRQGWENRLRTLNAELEVRQRELARGMRS
eukprot:TRINITY_DN4947_c0_g1_i2.p2 TRINITY_DN4947_c0_g1~~TRINITY_DN4947_c0_g1_i2.p2  ORF type:complete len:621 (-),score=148.87 TRINITY_DN4947_c0_g1_i2:3297-5159(-)